MVEKLKANDVSTSMIQNNQSFAESDQQNQRGNVDACDWTLSIDLRAATNLISK